MTEYWYNSQSGAIDTQDGIVQWFNEHTGINDLQRKYLDWHGPFQTKEDAFQFYVDNKSAHPDWAEPTDSLWQTFKNNTGAYTGHVAGGVGDVLGIHGGQIDAGNWIIRIAEILVGIVLIGVGVAKLTGTGNAISKIAKVAI